MSVGEICTREVVFALKGHTVRQAAQLMREYHIGAVVVTDYQNSVRKPVGIITDRDIVVGVIAKGLDPDLLTVEEIMGQDLVLAQDSESEADTAQTMRVKGVRRLPVVNASGALIGIVTADDLLEILTEEMTSLSKMIAREQRRESEQRG